MMRTWITLVESRPDMSGAMQRLQDAGYAQIGDPSTAYGQVFRKPDDPLVLKLFDRSDKAFPAFINYVQTNPNTHLPKLRGEVVNITAEYAAIRMEYLSPLPRADRLADDVEGCVLAWINGPPVWPWVKKAMNRLTKTQPTLLAMMKDLTENLLIGRGFFPDLKPEHFRQRGSTIVLIDAICGRGS